MCSYISSVIASTPCLSHSRAIAVSSSRVNTLPVGLPGVLSTMARVQAPDHRRDHGFGGTAGHAYLSFRVDLHPVEAAVFLCQRLADGWLTPGDRVLVEVCLDGGERGLLNLCWRRKVGESLGQVDGVVLQREPGHLPDHRLGQSRGSGRRPGELAAGNVGD